MAANISFEILGLDRLKQRFQAAAPGIRQEVKSELMVFAEEVMAASKLIVPVDTGALMNTGKVQPPVATDDEVSVTLGYGDESVGYALYVHEEMASPKGNPIVWTRPGSGPKYLENPLRERQDKLPGRITEAVKRGFKA